MSISSIRIQLISSLVVISGGLVACTHHERPSENERLPPAASASLPAHDMKAAVNDIVGARCDLETRCNNIGVGQKYDDRNACESKLQGSTADDINMKDCPYGVDQTKLSACLSEIKAEECGSPIDSVTRWNACRTGNLCAKGS